MEQLNEQKLDFKKIARDIEPSRYQKLGDISEVSKNIISDPYQFLWQVEKPDIYQLIESIVHWSIEKFGKQEFSDAKQDFFNLTGRVFPDEDHYNQRISYFLDYFVFLRPIQVKLRQNDVGQTPYLVFMDYHFKQNKKYQGYLQHFKQLSNFRHSLFQIKSVNKNYMVVFDYLTKEKHKILATQPNELIGFKKNAILQGILYIYNVQPLLSLGIILHPLAVTKLINKQIKFMNKNRFFNHLELMSKLAKQNSNYFRQQLQDPIKVYSRDT